MLNPCYLIAGFFLLALEPSGFSQESKEAVTLAAAQGARFDPKIRRFFQMINNPTSPQIVEDIKKKLKGGVSVNSRDRGRDLKGNKLYARDDDETPLLFTSLNYAYFVSGKWPEVILAARLKQIIELFIDYEGVDHLAQDEHGNTALMHLAFAGDVDLAQKLLDKITDPGQKLAYINAVANGDWTLEGVGGPGLGGTALLRAIYANQARMVHFLLKNGADIEFVDQNDQFGRSALPWALYSIYARPEIDFSAVISTLAVHSPSQINMRAGADTPFILSHIMEGGDTPLIHLIINRRPKEAKALLLASNIELNVQNNEGCTALIEAARRNLADVVQALSQKDGINPNIACYDGTTALTAAAKIGSAQMTNDLVNIQSLDPNLPDREGPALIHAIGREDATAKWEAVVGKLLTRGDLNLNARDSQERPAIVLATERKVLGILKALLLRQGSLDVNATDSRGRTAYSVAVQIGWVEGACALLRHPRINVVPTDFERQVCALDAPRGTP